MGFFPGNAYVSGGFVRHRSERTCLTRNRTLEHRLRSFLNAYLLSGDLFPHRDLFRVTRASNVAILPDLSCNCFVVIVNDANAFFRRDIAAFRECPFLIVLIELNIPCVLSIPRDIVNHQGSGSVAHRVS